MKSFCLLMLLTISSKIYAQQLHGTVKDALTLKPIANAKVITTGPTIYTDQLGCFTLPRHNQINARFSVRVKDYKIIEVILKTVYTDTIRLLLNPIPFELRETGVGTRDNIKTK